MNTVELGSRFQVYQYDRTQAGLRSLKPGQDDHEIDRLLIRLAELRDAREGLADRVRKSSPRAAALQYPQPLDAETVRRTLDPGTLLLSCLGCLSVLCELRVKTS